MDGKRKYNILIVEDDKFYAQLLIDLTKGICNTNDFPDFEFNIKSFLSGKSFVEHLNEDIDLVFLDFYLDEHDVFPYNGFDIIRVLHNECKDCKVVVISALRNPEIKEQLKQAGIYGFVNKTDDSPGLIKDVLLSILNEERQKLSRIT